LLKNVLLCLTARCIRAPSNATARRFARTRAGRLARGATTYGKDQAVGNLLRTFAGNQQGAAAIEYGLLAAGIAVAIIAVIAALGTNLNTTFTDVSSAVK